MAGKGKSKQNDGGVLAFETELWAAADKMSGHMDASEYKHVVLGLICPKYIFDTFEENRAKLGAGKDDYADANSEIRTNTKPKMSFGLRKKLDGHISRPTQSSRPSTT